MPKSKDAFRTISEVAEWLDTPAHVLRFWESKFTQVKPVKRAGGRRYYRPADMQLLGGIKKLLHDDGLTIKGAQKLLREHGVKHVVALSQPLDEDLIDEDAVVAEAAYEPDAQPEPIDEPASTVLSFPSRSETKTADAVGIETSIAEPVSSDPVDEPQTLEPTAQDPATKDREPEFVASHETTDNSSDTPAFGSDALPAFLRRAPTPQMPEDVNEVASAEPTTSSSKVTIDPEARFEPFTPPETEVGAEAEETPEIDTPSVEAPPQAQPMFSRRTESPQSEAPKAPVEDNATPVVEDVAAAPKAEPILVDVPSIAKIAPAIDSYIAPAGVLAALPGARRLAPELASQLSDQLMQLRALRDRMQNH